MVRVYGYRLYPTRSQDAALRQTLECLRELYNAALQERREAYRRQRVSLSAHMQMKELRGVREVRPEYAEIHTHLLQDAITRLDGAYKSFFRRVKAGEKPGYPRFKGRGRYKSFAFKDAANRNGARLVAGGRRLELTGVGKLKLRLHRSMAGTLKQVCVTLAGDGHWYAGFVCADVPARSKERTGLAVGVDVGITSFAMLSNGESVDNQRPYETAQRRLKAAQQRVSHHKRGSARRRKAVELLAKQHDKVARVRLDFQHKVALDLVRGFDMIAVEDLNVQGLAAGMLAKQVHDAAWAQFITILAGKAESAGRELVEVNPRGTSQQCSGCGTTVPKPLGVRVHTCSDCGLVLDRDHNAAINYQHSTKAGTPPSGRIGCSICRSEKPLPRAIAQVGE